MTTHANAQIDMTGWDEKTVHENDGHKLTRAEISTHYTGDLEGEGKLEYLLSYRADGTGVFIGLERIEGRLGNRSGSFALQHEGIFQTGLAKANYKVVPGSG